MWGGAGESVRRVAGGSARDRLVAPILGHQSVEDVAADLGARCQVAAPVKAKRRLEPPNPAFIRRSIGGLEQADGRLLRVFRFLWLENVGPGVIGPNRRRQDLKPAAFRLAPGLKQERRVVFEALGHQGMTLAEHLAPNRQGPLKMGFGLLGLALGGVENAQVVQARRHVRVLRPQGLLGDAERLAVDRLGVVQLALGVVVERQVVEAGRDLRVLMISLGAVLNLPFLTLSFIAGIMNAETVRRIVVARRGELAA